MARYLTCPFCGFEFERGDTLCAHGCPIGAVCHLIRCPTCGYEFPETPTVVSWLRRLFTPARIPVPAVACRTVAQLRDGERARVVDLISARTSRRNALAVFGLIPGAEITLIQRRPSFVLRVGETELALDSEIAREILVEGSYSEVTVAPEDGSATNNTSSSAPDHARAP
ncbi:MAG TPA: FeoA family protein [Gemmatimonadales bacterium]|jgi:Fe2+ transport system protein FeoA